MKYLSFCKQSLLHLVCLFCPLYIFSQVDTVPPQLACKGFQEINMGVFCQLGIFFIADELLETYADNVTPAAQLETGLRLRCLGTGFPEGQPRLWFYSNDLYSNSCIEVWVRDQAGNTAVCETSIQLVDNWSNCDPIMSAYATFAENILGINKVLIDIRSTRCPNEHLQIQALTNDGWWLSAGGIPTGYQTTVSASKNSHPLNGITIHDLFLISQHVQGATPLTNPYQLLAADANQDGQITALDILTLRRLMRGTITQLPNGRSWRFVPADFVFDPLQPFVFPEIIETNLPVSSFHFRGVKIGDVDFSADPGL